MEEQQELENEKTSTKNKLEEKPEEKETKEGMIIEKESEKKDRVELPEIKDKEREKIEEIGEKIKKLKEEEIKNIKLIPKQELIIVVIYNITPNVSEGHLKEIFSNYGEIKEVYIPINKETQLKKNYAFIEFTKKENAEKAQLYMDEGQIDGKVVKVEILSPKNYIELN